MTKRSPEFKKMYVNCLCHYNSLMYNVYTNYFDMYIYFKHLIQMLLLLDNTYMC